MLHPKDGCFFYAQKKGGVALEAKYTEWLSEEGLNRLRGYARDGATDEEIAKKVGVSRSTLSTWKKRHASIALALKEGKELVDNKVEESLLKCACGYIYEEEILVQVKQSDGSVKVETRVLKRYAAPSVTAQIFWLKNRRPDKWRDKPKEEEEQETLAKLDAVLGKIEAAF